MDAIFWQHHLLLFFGASLIVDEIKARLYLAHYYKLMLYFASVVSNFLAHPGNRMLVGDLYKNIFKHTHWHINYFKLEHLGTHMLMQTVML